MAGGAVLLGLAILSGVALGLEPGADRAGDPWHAAPPAAIALVVAGAGLGLTGRWRQAHVLAVPPALIVFTGALGALYGRGAHAALSESVASALVTLGSAP
jgi:hypothetical protein